VLFFVLLACPSDPSGETGAAPEDSATGGESAASCQPPTGITVAGELRPGNVVQLEVIGPGDAGAVSFTVDAGSDDAGTMSPEGAWTIASTLAVDQAAAVTIAATACDTRVTLDVEVDWREADRVVVLYNDQVDRSEEVALAYAAFREVPDTAVCPVSSVDATTLPGAEYPAFVDAAFACAGPQTHYLVPVWGVPYKVSDRIGDLATGTPVTVSLDALLFGGPDSVALSAVDYNPIYLRGDSPSGDLGSYKPIGRLRQRFDAWLVTRIDGASADDALALIERTRVADAAVAAGTLDGIVYVDGNRGDTPPADDAAFGSYEWGEWNMWGTRNLFEDLGVYPVVWDGNADEFGTAPAPTECPDALYYAGWYSYYHYNDCFTWTTGAIGAHLDSCSACDIRNPGTWSGSALLDGITATFGAVNEPYVAGMPEYDQFFAYLLQGANFAEAGYESTVAAYWMMVWVGDPLYRPYGADPLLEP
jgi:uncharacterized protein (TIGR03790 family)